MSPAATTYLVERPAVRWLLTIFFSALILLVSAVRFLFIGSRLIKVTDHKMPEKLQKNYQHAFVKLASGLKLHYVEKGPKDGPLMLLVHGFPEFWYSWRFQIANFSKTHRVVAIDMRGYGESDKPEGMESYQLDVLATDIKQCIEALGHSKAAVLGGHDWGGLVSWRATLLFPDLIERLFICNCPHPGIFRQTIRSSFTQALMSWYIYFFQMPRLPEFLLAADDFAIFEKMFYEGAGALCNKENLTPSDLEAWKHTYSQPGALTPVLNYYRALLQVPPDVTPYDIVKVKTLVLWGENDVALSREMGRESAEACRDGRCIYVPNASHWLQQDRPDVVNREVAKFIKE